jgi:hypothetical protein
MTFFILFGVGISFQYGVQAFYVHAVNFQSLLGKMEIQVLGSFILKSLLWVEQWDFPGDEGFLFNKAPVPGGGGRGGRHPVSVRSQVFNLVVQIFGTFCRAGK